MPHRHRFTGSLVLSTEDRDQERWFVAMCSCGWRSGAVRAQRVLIEHEDHVDEVRRRASEAGGP
ncbi:MAG TPA: hypothetical protein VFK42_14605 [Acidimicrobiales bacterium]|jgi:hypothetical protein|nr:hypothetical protein [Acidimicrobiales bacterium]